MHTAVIQKKTNQTLIEHSFRSMNITVEEHAQLDLFILHTNDQLTDKVQHTITLQDNAVARVFSVVLGSAQYECNGVMQGNHTAYEHRVIYIGHQSQRLSLHLYATHQGRNTMSRIIARGVALESAQVDLSGSINIEQTGAGADGHLEHEGLLLSKKARIDSLPGLEIGTDDVKASHSSAVHYIRPEQLFYLQSRGIDIPEAKK